jgi:membrane-associated phospholipid phosphatase
MALSTTAPAMNKYFPGIYRHIAARFAPDTQFGLHLTVGIVLLWLAAWIFGEIASDVVARAHITVVDLNVANWFHQHAKSAWTPLMLVLTNWHDLLGTLIMCALLAVFFYRKGAHYWLATLVLAMSGGMLLNLGLKFIFQRARPTFEDPLLTLASFSFPSGHTTGATLFYGVLMSYLIMAARNWSIRALVALAGVGMIALVALSRVYLGAHFLSDVLAAMSVSVGWLAICITGMSTLRRRHAINKTE